MMDYTKYGPGYFAPPQGPCRWASRDHVTQAPQWCSVDLRDGNQSLMVPMDLDEKLAFFDGLVALGFKEVEVGFPAASDTEYRFVRCLIEQDRIPPDVTIQVLTPCREDTIRRTFEAVNGAHSAIIHFYNPLSRAQREQVFRMSRAQVKEIALTGARLVKTLAPQYEGSFRFEYSPESFTATEPEYALEVCSAVLEVLRPSQAAPVIINLPATVSLSMSHVFANQVEYLSDHLPWREHVILSVHPHNDRGCAVSDTELALLAGAQRVEGTLFGNGERTGNVDLVTLALNLYTHGVAPGLDLSHLPQLVQLYERVTRMQVPPRSPYAGALVFAAFSGGHQDAIAKSIHWRQEHPGRPWDVPYIPLDPHDLGRTYDADVIRINSQSGKGGIAFLLEEHYGFVLPRPMQEHFGRRVKSVSDHAHKELTIREVYQVFQESYLNKTSPLNVTDTHYVQKSGIFAVTTLHIGADSQEVSASGNGRLDAVSNAIQAGTGLDFTVDVYTEHALGTGTTSQAATYVGLLWEDGTHSWGAGTDNDILTASIKALVSAINSH